jgi:hypothetical protein
MDYVVLFIIIFIIVIYIIRSNAVVKSTGNAIFSPRIIPPPIYKNPPLFPDNKVYDDLSLASSNESSITDSGSKDTSISPLGPGKDQYFIDSPRETQVYSIYNNPYKKDEKVSKYAKRYRRVPYCPKV